MTNSMTGFARIEHNGDWGALTWELRSVNHRYLEVSFRLPEMFRELEASLRSQCQTSLSRGKVDCGLKFSPGTAFEQNIAINETLSDALTQAQQLVLQRQSQARPLSVSDYLKWPGMIEITPQDLTQVNQHVTQAYQDGLDALHQARAKEGEKLNALIAERVRAMQPLIDQVKPLTANALNLSREKMMTRLQEIQAEFDNDRLEQEMLYLAQKADITEEIDRLETHLKAVQDVLALDQPAGRRLDFLIQECHREVNTLGTKGLDTTIKQIAVDLKVLVEQMREQVQNIE